MGLSISDIKDIVLKSYTGSPVTSRAADILKGLIENDKACSLAENNIYPKVWECRWLNNDGDRSEYYKLGESVWVNTETPEQMLATRRSEVLTYVENNPVLNPLYEKINKNDAQAVNQFLIKAIKGTASPSVSAIYYLGDMLQPVQIKVSKKPYNRDYPSVTSSWYDFYTPNTEQDNYNMMISAMYECIDEQLAKHVGDYHALDTDRQSLNQRYIRKNPLNLSQVRKQAFYSHSYGTTLDGFDYVKDFGYQDNRWYRLWNSGYLEQGGYVLNSGGATIDVDFMVAYNYPAASNFYQVGYDTFQGQQVEGGINAQKRYCVFVTPVTTAEPYAVPQLDVDGYKTYTNVDVMGMNNSGFQFVNSDQTCETYALYYFYVAGYKTVTNEVVVSQTTGAFHRVDFYDTLG